MSTEVRKIEGWSVELDIDPDRFTFYPGVEQPNFPPPQYTVTRAVLVVGSKVAFTEDEVKAMEERDEIMTRALAECVAIMNMPDASYASKYGKMALVVGGAGTELRTINTRPTI